MPGVPSSRGCDACRQAKKKCDLSAPSCSRCTRLAIPCVGSGQRRYKFMAATDKRTQATGGAGHGSGSSIARSASPLSSRLPPNQATQDLSNLISTLQVTDVRFDLRICGPFFPEIPRRLGRSQALDASVRALVLAFPSVYTHQYTTDMYKSYGEALRHLRTALADASTASSPDTLCAVYLIMICQGWIGKGADFFPSHGEAMAHMLNTAAARGDWTGNFEAELVNTLLALVLLESFANHKIKLDPRLWTPSPGSPAIPLPSRPSNKAADIECLRPANLAAVSSFTRDIQGNLPAIISMYQTLQNDLAKMKTLLSGMVSKPSGGLTLDESRLHVRRQTGYGVLLLLGMMANWALSAYGVGDASALQIEKDTLVDEVAELAGDAVRYRPLGSGAMPGFIMAARAITGDADRLERLERLLELYRSDFPAGDWDLNGLPMDPVRAR